MQLGTSLNEIGQRCEAVWQEMQPTSIPAAKELATKIAADHKVEVTFHSHDGSSPAVDVLFGARFCGQAAETFFAGREWSQAVIAMLASAAKTS